MKIRANPLNSGETFCCSMQRAKEVFRDTNVYLSFAYFMRNYGTFKYTPDAYYMMHNIKGRVLMHITMRENYRQPILSFYPVKSKYFTNEMKDEVEQNYILEFYRLYKELSDVKQPNGLVVMMLLELRGEKLILHRTRLDK